MKLSYQIIMKCCLVFGVMLFVSCGGETTSTVTQKKVRTGLDKYNNGYELSKGEHGTIQSKSSKKSSYNDLRASAISSVKKPSYTKESYRRKRWGGDSTYGTKSYSGTESYSKTGYKASKNTNFDKGYNAGSSRFEGQTFATSNSTAERRTGYVQTGTSSYVDSRDNAPAPTIFSRDEYNKLGIQQSNQLLGR